jgi:hypothetical protein
MLSSTFIFLFQNKFPETPSVSNNHYTGIMESWETGVGIYLWFGQAREFAIKEMQKVIIEVRPPRSSVWHPEYRKK